MTDQRPTTADRISEIIRRAAKESRKPGVSPKLLNNIRRSAELQSSQGSNIKAR